MFEPKVSVNPRDIYVYQTNLPNPYDLLQLTHINASDYQGNKIYLDKQHLILDTSKVDYSHTGTYTVSISVMDNEMNMTLDYLTIHVLSPEEADRINAKYQSQQVPEKTTKQKNHKHRRSGGLQPINREKGIRYFEKHDSSSPSKELKSKKNNHIFDRTSTYLIIALVTASLVAFAYYMFF
ncbi:MAG: hypothetical protein L0G48_12780 [Staphylococcus equorum]|nr:hypothetical protein [Staphylococcus equorum]